MKIKSYGIAKDSAPGMRIIDGWFLNCIDLPFSRSVGLPNEMRGVNQNDILRMLEKVADRFERGKADDDLKPIPPVHDDSPRSRGGRSVAFDAKRFPCTSKFCPDRTEGARDFVARVEALANRQPGPAERAFYVGLLHYSRSLRPDAQVRDLDAALIENSLENLTRTQISG